MADEERTSPWGDAALAVWSVLGDRPVAYHPALAKALGNDIPAALFLAQIMYWADKGTWKPGWVAKTQQEIYDETALTRSQQERVRRKLIKLGVLSEKLMDVPARLYFRVHFARLTKLLMLDLHLQQSLTSDCGKPAIKDAENQQSEPAEPADQDAGNQQSIPESTAETTPKSTPEKSDGEPSHTPVLDAVFPDSAEIRSDGVVIKGDIDDLTPDEKAQIATPGSGQARQNMDLVQAAWYNCHRNIRFPHGVNWVDTYEYAVLFSGLFAIAVPSSKTAIGQWRKGIVETIIAVADELDSHEEPKERSNIMRRARWALQVLHARRATGDDWAFDIVSPLSTVNTIRVILGDLRKMQDALLLADSLPQEDQITDYYSQVPHKRKRTSGADTTEQTILQLEAAAELQVVHQ